MTIVAITGHRPERIPSFEVVDSALLNMFVDVGATTVIQGLAAGVDLHAGQVAIKQGLDVISAKPYSTHKPRVADKELYQWVIDHSVEVHVVTEGGYAGPWLYQRRNEWMVDHGDIVLAVWDGVEKGGTWNCIDYALDCQKVVHAFNPETRVWTELD